MAKLIQRRALAATPTFGQQLPSRLRHIYAARGITDETQLQLSLANLLPFDDLLGITAATTRLITAITEQQRILIIGDFDADGATSTALAVRALRMLGALHVNFLVPNRFDYGYGLTPEIVQVAAEWQPQVIITVDNGMSSCNGVDAARELGIDVIITDHHLAGDELPQSVAIVNPNQPGCCFASKNLAGVGVIFYVMLAVRRALAQCDWFQTAGIPIPNMASLLDIVALGTVADVVPLDYNNRILVKQGLLRIRLGQCNAGITALLNVAKRVPATITTTDLGFAVAPRLNAAGRLQDMSLGVACLLEDDPRAAQDKALQLDNLNQERKAIELSMKQQAFSALAQISLSRDMPLGLTVFHENWHQGVIGILAGRIKEQYHRPTIVFAKVADNELKGSARSVAGVHIRDVLAGIHRKLPHMMQKFGGHAMAAGLTIQATDFAAFAAAFAEEVGQYITAEDLQDRVTTDGELAADEFHLTLAEQLRDAGPWGQQFPEPLFDGEFILDEQRIVGERHLKLVVIHPETGQRIPAMQFNADMDVWPNYELQYAKIVYRLDINEYRQSRTIQLLIDYLEPMQELAAM